MGIYDLKIKNKIVTAPLAGYTNPAFRRIVKSFGAGLVFSEMISANGLVHENARTWELTKIYSNEHPIALQLFGGDIEMMVKAALLIEERTNCDIIDINMGCPVPKVLKAQAGSSMLKDTKKIEDMVRAITNVVRKPVSVKIRAGITHKNINCDLVAEAAERGGASLITIHGRTQTDLYRGKVNYDYIKKVKQAVSIPVIGNGDIKSIEDAKNMLDATGVDFIMIGRGALGNPWLIRDLVDFFSGKNIKAPPTIEERVAMCKKHFLMLLEEKPEHIAVLEMRTWAIWYLKGISNIRILKQQIVKTTTKEELLDLLTLKNLEQAINKGEE